MVTIYQIRGAILEEAVAFLLKMVGYVLVEPGAPGTRKGPSGLDVQGRGCWHQIDNLAVFDGTPAFMYPLRLILEAKCYGNSRRVGVDVVRNAIGVLKDISENYFTHQTLGDNEEIQIQRFNYHSAIFSTSGYSSVAQKYAIAHQVFLIDYKEIDAITSLIDSICKIELNHFNETEIKHPGKIKKYFAILLENSSQDDEFQPLSEPGERILRVVEETLHAIKGSYFGMLQGRWPLHLLSAEPLPEELFRNTDVVRCHVYGYSSHKWSFSPINVNEDNPNWFKLEFKLPEEIANLVASSWDDPVGVAHTKEQHFSYMQLSGKIGNIHRRVKLELDREWIQEYKQRMRKKPNNESTL
jgi:hypothetical protein